MIYVVPLGKWHNWYDMLMLKHKKMTKLRCYAWNAWKLNPNLFYLHVSLQICHWYIVLQKNWCEHCFKTIIDLHMPKAIISVSIFTNTCIDRYWKTGIGTVKYSIASTFRSTYRYMYHTAILLWKVRHRAVPYNFLHTFNRNISKD